MFAAVMSSLHYLSKVRPWLGSDFAFCVPSRAGANPAAIFGVVDTIGTFHALILRAFIRRIIRKIRHELLVIDSPERLSAAVINVLMAQNQSLLALKRGPTEEPLGFCVALGGITGNQCLISSLGDCRAYRITPPVASHTAPRVTCLTRDHNGIQTVLQDYADTPRVFLKNELHERGRLLSKFWGKYNDEELRAELQQGQVRFELNTQEGLMLMTDGLYLPMVHSIMRNGGYRLSARDYYLEPWLSDFISRGEYLQGEPDLRPNWQSLLVNLFSFARDYTAKRPRYRDDMAILMLFQT
jgi:serine/threonine protein phosphatase PrpC